MRKGPKPRPAGPSGARAKPGPLGPDFLLRPGILSARDMKNPERKTKNKRLTPSGIVGAGIGLGLIVVGFYHAIVLGNPAAHFVMFLGVVFCAVIIWFYKG